MNTLQLVVIFLHTTTNGLGLLFNGLLIFLVLTKTPKLIKTYSILILNFAVCDFCACFFAGFVQQRLIPGGRGLFYFSHGACTIFGSNICFYSYSVMLHCYAHTLWSLLLSFSYRYYILGHEQPTLKTLKLLLLFVYMPSLFQMLSFCFANDPVILITQKIAEKFPEYDLSKETISGHSNIFEWKTLFTILHMTLPVSPVYICILILRKKIIWKLSGENLMSKNTKHMHSQLLKALTYQACLPIFFLLAVMSYGSGQLGLYNHPLLEYSTFLSVGMLPVLSPLTSLYFVKPYREWIKNKIGNKGKSRIEPLEGSKAFAVTPATLYSTN